MFRNWWLVLVMVLWSVAGLCSEAERIKQGEYIFRAAGCAGCHTDADHDGAFLAGGRALETEFGTFYTSNITPHPDFGIGRWSEEDFLRALTEGISPEGKHYYPTFPYPSYTRMSREDILALWAYLRTVPAAPRPNQAHELPWYLGNHYINLLWKLIYFNAGEYKPQANRSSQWNRGSYLSQALSHCSECHTPRSILGALDQERLNAGTKNGPGGEVIPNITPDRKTGIGRWTEDDLAYFLETGATPDGDYTANLMAEVIDEGLQYLNQQDLRAIAHYILSLPPVEHAVKRRKKKRRGEFD